MMGRSMITLQERIDRLGEEAAALEHQTELKVKEIDLEMQRLNRLICPHCEGSGEFKFRDYQEVCKQCSGTGYKGSNMGAVKNSIDPMDVFTKLGAEITETQNMLDVCGDDKATINDINQSFQMVKYYVSQLENLL